MPSSHRPTSIAIRGSETDSQSGNVTQKEAASRNGGIVILRVKELAANKCLTPTRLKVVPKSLASDHSNAVDIDENGQPQSATETDAANEAAIPTAAAAATDRHLTQLPVNNRLSSIAENHRSSIVATAAKPLQRHKRAPNEKTISCRLYDCIIPAACTARNASSEPPESRTPSVVKFDLGGQVVAASPHQPQQQRISSSSSSLISRTAQLSKRKFLLDIMDRSVDSIGSCSLDVDAESTDFSGSQTGRAKKKAHNFPSSSSLSLSHLHHALWVAARFHFRYFFFF